MAILAVVAAGAFAGFEVAGIVGAVVGAGLGFLGSKLLNRKKSSSSLDDLKITKVSYGSVIPWVKGHPRINSFVGWQSAFRKSDSSSSSGGGSGGGSATVTTTSYSCDALFVLTENIAGDNLRKVWWGGEPAWAQGQEYGERWDSITFYNGGPAQMPDPTYEAAVTTARALAYRTRCSVFIENIQLGTSAQLPNLTFEIGPDATKARAGTIISLWNFGATGDLVLPAYPPGTPTESFATKNDLSELVSPNSWQLSGNDLADSFIDASGLHLQEYAAASSDSCSVFQSVVALPISGDFTLEIRVNPLSDSYSNSIAGAFHVVNAVASGAAGLVANGDYLLTKVFSGGPKLQFAFRDAGVAYTVSSGTTNWDPTGLNEISVVRKGSTLSMFLQGVLVGSSSCGTGALGAAASVNIGGRNSGAHLVPNDFAPGLYTGFRLTSGLARYTGTYAIGQAWTLDGSVVDVTTYSSEPSLQSVVEDLCVRGEMDLANVDATALTGVNVHGIAVTQVSAPRETIQTLKQSYFFTSAEVGSKVVFDWRGKNAVATIPFEDLIAVDDGLGEPLEITLPNDVEIPSGIDVKYSNLWDDYQDGLESSDRLISEGESTSVVEIPIVLSPVEAKQIADSLILDAVGSAQLFTFGLTRKYSYVEAADVLNVVDASGVTFRCRVTKRTEADGVINIEAVGDDANVVLSLATTTTTGYTNSSFVQPPIDTGVALLDIPILRDADNDGGFYAVVAPTSDVAYPGAVLFSSGDNLNYSRAVTAETSGVIGTANTILGSGPVGVFDEFNSVTVNIGVATASSVTRDSILNSTVNTWVIGAEVIQARDATLVSLGVYKLTGLLRGLLGTEWAVGSHVANEVVAMPTSSTAWRVPMNNSDLGISKYWKAVTVGRAIDTATAETFTDNAVGLKPRAPVDVRFAHDATSADVTITLQRRSRLSSRLIGALGVSCPLGEDSESYSIDIYDSGFTTVKRTIAGASPSFSYTAAMQTSDFGSTQATVYAKAYQISGTVGRGYAAQAQG